MEHIEASESEGDVGTIEVFEDLVLRGNRTRPTSELLSDGSNVGSDNDELTFGQDEVSSSMEVYESGMDGGSMVAASDDGSSAAVVGPHSMTGTAAAPIPAGGDGVEGRRTEELIRLSFADTAQRDTEADRPLNGGPSASPGKSATSSDTVRTTGSSAADDTTPQQSLDAQPDILATDAYASFSVGTSSFDHGQEMSVDEEDDDDVLSGKASSEDFLSDSDAFVRTQTGRTSADRVPLEEAYGPFIHPTDTCLADARERLHVALEQTRLLGQSFTEQAYDRYRCLMKPVPEVLEDIIEPILVDPDEAMESLREEADAIKEEKDVEIKHARQAGVGLEELAYFGEGLHLVILPEDEVDETEIDITAFPDRGPINPESGEPVEEISAAAAAATEQVFDRIRRIRSIRMGGDIKHMESSQAAGIHLNRDLARDHQSLDESFSPGLFASSAFALISPALSVDNNARAVHQQSSKGALQHLLTLAPGAESSRPDGTLTASQWALIARGVGMHELKHDSRMDPLRQRMVQRDYFSPTTSPKFLPPLHGPHQIYRLQAVNVRSEKPEVRSGARESIKSVLEDISSSLGGSGVDAAGEYVKGRRIDDIGARSRSSWGTRRALNEEHSALEIGLLHRMHMAMLESTSNAASQSIGNAESTDLGSISLCNTSDNDDFDPLLAFSVMNAVGLVRRKDGNCNHQLRRSGEKADNAYVQELGLDSLISLASVKQFFDTTSTIGNGETCNSAIDDIMDAAKLTNSTTKSATSHTHIGTTNDGIHEIRGGGGQDDVLSIGSKTLSKETGEVMQNGVSKSASSKVDVPISDPSSAHSLAGYAGISPIYRATSQVSPWQHQLGISPDLYHSAPSSHQLNGSHLSSFHSDLSDFYLRNGLMGTPQHPQFTNSLGMVSLNVLEQELARTMLLRDQHDAAAARAHEIVTAAASARFQASLSSIIPQNPFGCVASSPQDRSYEFEFNTSSLAPCAMKDPRELHRKRSWSLSETASQIDNSNKKTKASETPEIFTDLKRSASAPPLPLDFDRHTPDGSLKSKSSHAFTPITDNIPVPSMGLHEDIVDLIVHAKFHEAYSLSQSKSDKSEDHLVKFLLSLGAAIPIPKALIADTLEKKIGSSYYHLQLHEFAGSSTSATALREAIVAIISIWLWTEHKNCFNQNIVESGNNGAGPSYNSLVNLAIDLSLSALANFSDSHPSGKCSGQTNETPTEQIAAIASKSLASQVFFDYRTDASFLMIEDLVKLLDSLRTDALRAKTQERVLVAALVSRCGNMTEAFSNAYVSSIVRSGVALGHENVCEMGQDEACRASTLLPYDYFHDNFGVWEEPCRPIAGYHAAVGGDELKRQAHARSLIQKSMLRLQHRLGLKGGISDGGPYYTAASTARLFTPSTSAAVPQLVKTPSGSLKRRDSTVGVSGPGDDDFNPDHSVEPMLWNPDDLAHLPYGEHEFGGKPMCSLVINDASSTAQYPSTQELEWEDVANMFFHGGSTRSIDIDYDFGSQDQLGKKKIYAPFVQPFDISSITQKSETGQEHYSDEDISDKTVLQRHQNGLDEMKMKLNEALESRKLLSQQRGRKR